MPCYEDKFVEVKFTSDVVVAKRLMNIWQRAVNSKIYARAPWNKKRIGDAKDAWHACLIAQEEALGIC